MGALECPVVAEWWLGMLGWGGMWVGADDSGSHFLCRNHIFLRRRNIWGLSDGFSVLRFQLFLMLLDELSTGMCLVLQGEVKNIFISCVATY